MRIRVEGKRKVFIGRVKVYGKGTVNLPKEVLELLSVGRGEELIISAREGVAEMRKPRSLEELAGSLKGLKVKEQDLPRIREYTYLGFRNAFADAHEFFEDIKDGLPYGEGFVVGEFHNKVYIQLESGDLRKSIHISYFELPKFPRGVITIDGGIKEFLESEKDKSVVDENKKRIREALSCLIPLEEFGDNGFMLIPDPEFSRKETALLSVVVDKLKG